MQHLLKQIAIKCDFLLIEGCPAIPPPSRTFDSQSYALVLRNLTLILIVLLVGRFQRLAVLVIELASRRPAAPPRLWQLIEELENSM
jgi:hypothetical protein